jgi:hypothetical protein
MAAFVVISPEVAIAIEGLVAYYLSACIKGAELSESVIHT